ncbi:hypothetical protein NCG97_25475 [Streptomyces lydicamycinicus]|uniref:hypothetical protein n=1 Tax=Streptomyces lydicamycinicus TaxID=1546107 RepID=UPI0020361FB6|nr:hypothetical protein [Streptomyces lydicamycinicus]USA03227.1 hypothetical protein NCG97_25475 [Streptomyces lydicamycinicus]
MTHHPATPLRLALRLAAPDTADALAERQRPELLTALADRFGLPEEMVETLIGPGGQALRAALDADPEAFLLRAAETGDPVIARAVWRARYRIGTGRTGRARDLPDLLPAILRAADVTDPRWVAEDGLVPLLQEEATSIELLPALTGPFPQLISFTLVQLARLLPLPVAVDACIAMVQLAGAEALPAFADGVERIEDFDLGRPELLDLMRAAAADDHPESFLRERRPAGEWTDPAVLRALLKVREGSHPGPRPAALDWELVRREHARLPFGTEPSRRRGARGDHGLLQLSRWEGCPEEPRHGVLPRQPLDHLAGRRRAAVRGAGGARGGSGQGALRRGPRAWSPYGPAAGGPRTGGSDAGRGGARLAALRPRADP